MNVAQRGLQCIAGAGAVPEAEMAALEANLGMPAIHRAQAGLIQDMDFVADAVYDRAAVGQASVSTAAV